MPSYPVREQDGFVYFWYHASGQPPAYEIPRLTEFDDPEWSAPYPWRFELTAVLQEMAENNVDYAHLKYVHRRQYVPTDTSALQHRWSVLDRRRVAPGRHRLRPSHLGARYRGAAGPQPHDGDHHHHADRSTALPARLALPLHEVRRTDGRR